MEELGYIYRYLSANNFSLVLGMLPLWFEASKPARLA